jgi:signal transduction histidine kinase
MKFQSLTIRTRLLWLTLGLVVPLVLAGFFNLWSDWQASRKLLNESVEQQAELAATAFDQWIQSQTQTLYTIKDLTENNQSPLALKEYLNSIVKTRPHWLDVQIVGANGEVKLSQSTKDRPLPLISIETLKEEIVRKNSLVILTEQISEEELHILSLAMPLTNGDFVVARIDGTSASQVFEQLQLPSEHIIAVFDGNNSLLYRSHITPEQMSQYVSNTPLLSAFNEKSSGSIEVKSPYDKVKRVYGFTRLKEPSYVVAIGVPSSRLYEPAQQQFTRQLLFGLIITFLAILLAFVIARSITEPMHLLSKAARAFGGGDLSIRAEITESGATREVGLTFNQMAEQIAERETKLKELDRLKSEFVSNVSHELRTPLTTIKTLTRVLQNNNLTPAEREDYLQTIGVECDRQIDFVQNLLDLSRIESGAYRINLSPTDAGQILENCFTSQRHAAAARSLQLKFQASDTLPLVLTDATALRRIVLSLLENALKYTPENGVIRLSAERVEDRVMISICDTGCGIAPKDIPHIFEKFYRGNGLPKPDSAPGNVSYNENECLNSNEFSGVGLGLYLVKTLIDQIGAEINVESPVTKDRQGTKFTLLLPVYTESEKVTTPPGAK